MSTRPGGGDSWHEAENQGLGVPPEEAASANFVGDVGYDTLEEVAAAQSISEMAPAYLWMLLDRTQTLYEMFMAQYGRPFGVGNNNRYRKSDLQKVAELEGLRTIRGFGPNSQAYKLLKAVTAENG